MKAKLKRILIILLSVVCSCCMLFPIASYSSIRLSAHADYLNKTEENEIWERLRLVYDMLVYGSDPNYADASKGEKSLFTILDEMEERLGTDSDIATVKSDVQLIKEQTAINAEDTTTADGIMKIPEAVANATSTVWDATIAIICGADPTTSTYFNSTTGSNKFFSFNPLNPQYNYIVDIFTVVGYSLVLVFFAVNLIEQSVKYEIFTVKGALQIFGRLLVAKLIIDASTRICRFILSSLGYIIVSVIAGKNFSNPASFMPTVDIAASKIKIIGPLIDTIVALCICGLLLIVVGGVFIMSILVTIKLIIRAFELTMLTVSSPLFFACASSDVTKEYFKKFIVTFLQVASQTLFMVIALIIGMDYFKSNLTTTTTITSFDQINDFLVGGIPPAVAFIAMCVVMIKPPKVLTGLLK